MKPSMVYRRHPDVHGVIILALLLTFAAVPEFGNRANAANGPPGCVIPLPSGHRCNGFDQQVGGRYNEQHKKEFKDKNGFPDTISAGTGSALRYTNLPAGQMFSSQSNGSVTNTTLTTLPPLSAIPQINNPSFEQVGCAPDKDPVGWQVTEGYTIKGTGIEITQHPRMIQAVSRDGALLPYDGSMMLRNRAELGLKSNVKQFFAVPMNSTFEVEFAVYVLPNYSQQVEFRYSNSGQQVQLHYTDQQSSLCLYEKNVNNCVYLKPLPANRWNVIHFKFISLGNSRWQVIYLLNRVRLFNSKSSGFYVDNSLYSTDQIGYIFLGDECEVMPCDGYGTVYYDATIFLN